MFPVEPEGNDANFVSPLIRFDNVLLTPHIGGSTGEAQVNIGKEVAAKLIRYSNNGSTITAVNFPEVSLPEHAGKCRLLHIHRNVPGVLAQINERFSRSGVNIAAQYLQTDARARLRGDRHRRRCQPGRVRVAVRHSGDDSLPGALLGASRGGIRRA